MIPRSALFGNPEKTQARVSPDGKYISFIAPRDGVLNVWAGAARRSRRRQAGHQRQKRGIRQHFWAFDNNTCCTCRTRAATRTGTCTPSMSSAGTQKDLTPYKGIQRARSSGLSWKKPGVVAVGLNDRAPECTTCGKSNIATGKRVLIEQNTQEFAGYDLDDDLKPARARRPRPTAARFLRRGGGKWVEPAQVSARKIR